MHHTLLQATIRKTISDLATVGNSVATLQRVPQGRKADIKAEIDTVREDLRKIARAAGVEY